MKNKEPLFYYNRQRITEYTNTITEVIEDVSFKFDIPIECIIIAFVCSVIPLFASLPILFSVCNEVSTKGGFEVFSDVLFKELKNRSVIRNNKGQLIANREVLIAVGTNFKPIVERLPLFKHCLEFVYNQRNKGGSYTNAYNSIIIQYYIDKLKFKDSITICLEEGIDLLLISHSLRNLLDLESPATNIKYLHKLYLLVEDKRTQGRADIKEMLSVYNKLNLFITD